MIFYIPYDAVLKHFLANSPAGLEKGITMVVFDRGGFRYEGRVKARTCHFVAKTICVLNCFETCAKCLALLEGSCRSSSHWWSSVDNLRRFFLTNMLTMFHSRTSESLRVLATWAQL